MVVASCSLMLLPSSVKSRRAAESTAGKSSMCLSQGIAEIVLTISPSKYIINMDKLQRFLYLYHEGSDQRPNRGSIMRFFDGIIKG
jgi:hypothetical protein